MQPALQQPAEEACTGRKRRKSAKRSRQKAEPESEALQGIANPFDGLRCTPKSLPDNKKRRGQDSNLRGSFPPTGLANRRFRPLSHLSKVVSHNSYVFSLPGFYFRTLPFILLFVFGSKVAPGGLGPPRATPPITLLKYRGDAWLILTPKSGHVKPPTDRPGKPYPDFPLLPTLVVLGRRRFWGGFTTSAVGAGFVNGKMDPRSRVTAGRMPLNSTRPKPMTCTLAVHHV